MSRGYFKLNILKIFWKFFEFFMKFYIIPWDDSNAWIANIFWTGPSHIRTETNIVSSAFCLWNNEKLLKNNQNLDWKMTHPPLKIIWCDLDIWILFRRLFVIFIFDIWHFIFFLRSSTMQFWSKHWNASKRNFLTLLNSPY